MIDLNCPFCDARVDDVEVDEDYASYYHYVFRCGTKYSLYQGGWTNRPVVGDNCSIDVELEEGDHPHYESIINDFKKLAERRVAHAKGLDTLDSIQLGDYEMAKLEYQKSFDTKTQRKADTKLRRDYYGDTYEDYDEAMDYYYLDENYY